MSRRTFKNSNKSESNPNKDERDDDDDGVLSPLYRYTLPARFASFHASFLSSFSLPFFGYSFTFCSIHVRSHDRVAYSHIHSFTHLILFTHSFTHPFYNSRIINTSAWYVIRPEYICHSSIHPLQGVKFLCICQPFQLTYSLHHHHRHRPSSSSSSSLSSSLPSSSLSQFQGKGSFLVITSVGLF